MKQRQVIKFFLLERVAIFILLEAQGCVCLTAVLLHYRVLRALIFNSLSALATSRTFSWLLPNFLTIVAENILHYLRIYPQGNTIEIKVLNHKGLYDYALIKGYYSYEH